MSKKKEQAAEPVAAQQRFNDLADELEGMLKGNAAPAEAQQGTLGSIVAAVWKIITALRAGDVRAVLSAAVEIIAAIRDLLPAPTEGNGGGEVINFQQQMALGGFDWTAWKPLLKAILAKVLPLILEL